ncbi:BFD-like [2Fe-2S] binding domain protein [Jeotgalicoccus saudimassiliensis]|uniref:BFD-like [2Fe-2S] binding domain protein n=1 Tax=Jeotgalicoccus saudimassiliensis TaxID=1461582 RepID=A0A078M3N9_9STAP|nr:(2Fe-2S)-binding protein [Jeotgalicoccus saudimassiliensis]CEA02138.1 BFD-like [2Fe-2S] binding domain protein [Jeotgalicoccus saudimassiliensis]
MNNDDLIVCRCEEVSYKTLKDTAEKFQCSSRELKLRTRAAMGYCGGRSCRPVIDQIANDDVQSKETVALKYQPPVRPISFGSLGGE